MHIRGQLPGDIWSFDLLEATYRPITILNPVVEARRVVKCSSQYVSFFKELSKLLSVEASLIPL